MRELFVSGRILDGILVIVALEVVVLCASAWRRRRPLPVNQLVHLAAGVPLLVALRCAVTGADYRVTAAFMTASLPAHIAFLLRRSKDRALDAAALPPAP